MEKSILLEVKMILLFLQLLRKLQSQGMTEEHEDKLLLLKDIMLKQQKAKSR